MLDKNDVELIRALLRDELQNELNPVKRDISTLKVDVSSLKEDVSLLKSDMSFVKEKVNNIEEKLDFTHNAAINLLDWSEEIHEAVVKQKLVKRVEHLERLSKTS